MADNFLASNLEFVNAVNHPNNKVVLASHVSSNSIRKEIADKDWGVVGVQIQDLMLNNAGTEWGSIFGESAVMKLMSGLHAQVTTVADVLMGIDRPQLKFQSILQTLLHYTGTRPFELSIPMLFIALTRKDVEENKVLNSIRLLKRAEYPSLPELSNTNLLVEAPLGYHGGDVTQAKGASGAIDVRIGRYFETRKRIMVVTNSSFALSKEKTSNGSPLFAIGTVNLVAHRILSAEEIEKYFLLN
jgi:hypothetical protein